MENKEKIIKELIKLGPQDTESLDTAKRKIAKKFKTKTFSNVELLKAYHNLLENKRIKENKTLENVLIKRKVRSLSGIVVVSVLTKPYPCPGKCIYCPSQKGIPKSYLEKEPAVMRAVLNNFDPYLQVKNRIKALKETGHPTDKIELRIIGATWSFYPKRYQTHFIKRCFEAANNKKSKNLKEAQKRNEKADHRIIGISIETRPDLIEKEEIKRLRKLGVTIVELGVQTIYDKILKLNKRGHNIEKTVKATRLLKDSGFKVSYQMMPNLAGSDLKKDKEMFKELFSNQDFQPDFLKIYPTAVIKGTELYKLWKKGEYKPYTEKQLKKLLKEIKKEIPFYVRIQRLIRDIPSYKIVEGPAKISNLRQIIQKEAEKEGWRCHCIRCREVKENYDPKEKLHLFKEEYKASKGREIFLSYENRKRTRLYSLLRLRIPYQTFLPILKDSAIVREIHTYGKMHPLKKKSVSPQHKGLGKKLIKKAENIAKKNNKNKITVISGVGVRGYYRKLGYKLKDEYMVKPLRL